MKFVSVSSWFVEVPFAGNQAWPMKGTSTVDGLSNCRSSLLPRWQISYVTQERIPPQAGSGVTQELLELSTVGPILWPMIGLEMGM